MAFAPLATVADLTALGIDTSNADLVDSLLASVSEAVREAAGVPISLETSTVSFGTEASRRIELPSRPVRSVASVLLDGEALTAGTDYVLRDGHLWRADGCLWHRYGGIPSELTVTFTHGLDEIPTDIVNLVCMLVAAGVAAAEDGFEGHCGLQYERGDDYGRGYLGGNDEVVDPTSLPERTKASLRARFGGGGPYVTGTVK